MRAALGCLLGSGRRGCLCGWGVDGACRPLSSKPMTHSLWPHPRAQIWGQAGQAAGATQVRVGPPRGSPRSLGVYWVPGLHMLDPPSDPFIQRRQLRPGGHGGGGLLLALRLPPTPPPAPIPPPGSRLCARRAWVRPAARAGRAAEEGTFFPVCGRAQAGAGSSWPRPAAPLPQSDPGTGGPVLERWRLHVALGKACLSSPAFLAPAAGGGAGPCGCGGHRPVGWALCDFPPPPCWPSGSSQNSRAASAQRR